MDELIELLLKFLFNRQRQPRDTRLPLPAGGWPSARPRSAASGRAPATRHSGSRAETGSSEPEWREGQSGWTGERADEREERRSLSDREGSQGTEGVSQSETPSAAVAGPLPAGTVRSPAAAISVTDRASSRGDEAPPAREGMKWALVFSPPRARDPYRPPYWPRG